MNKWKLKNGSGDVGDGDLVRKNFVYEEQQQQQNKKQIIKNYIHEINKLRTLILKENVISELELDNYILVNYLNVESEMRNNRKKNENESLKRINSEDSNDENLHEIIKPIEKLNLFYYYFNNLINQLWIIKKKIFFYTITTFIVIVIIVNYKYEASNLFMRNIQNQIYPGMRLWRTITMPILKVFPELTEFYDETCLLTNPIFQVHQLDCTPCQNILNVLDLTKNYLPNTESVPNMFKINDKPIDMKLLYEFYKNNKNVFKYNSYKIESTNVNIKNVDDLFSDFLNNTHQLSSSQSSSSSNSLQQQNLGTANKRQKQQTKKKQIESHNLWRINRMYPARILRQLLKCPNRLPATGQSIERFLAIDTPNGVSYNLPDTDCSNIFIIQTFGARTILLRPTNECKSVCRPITVRLPQSYVLNYDWWYWKPISLPDHQLPKTESISYIVSYC